MAMACSAFHRFGERLRTVFRRPELTEQTDLPAPPPPPHPHSMAQGQFAPPQFAHENSLQPPNIPGYVPQYPPAQRQHPDPPQANVPPPLKTCSLCLEPQDDKASNFPFSCPQCNASHYCATCLKGWFIDACKNESKMPPTCCGAIPLSSVKKSMTTEQMGLYKAKFEEWMTPDKIYCPVKTCSAFIPPRLFQKPRKVTPVQAGIPAASPGDSIVTNSQAPPAAEVKINATCPKCAVQVCTKCRSLAHDGACMDDLDPELAEQLKKWKVKRCPRCRTGIRKVYGCSHVECRCGAHFCWECLQPADECGGACDDNAPDESGIESDDIDGLAGYFEGDGHEFGPEPENEFTLVWNCPHTFDSPRSALPEDAECYCCFRPVKNIVSDTPEIVQGPSGDANKNVEEADKGLDAVKAWQCHSCEMITCGDCKGTLEDD
ncbi:hypothetical protein DL95DRAFT_385094 [Leptodontidium sp. 2 PMI_412]|nr:hypothetical protein DL95DRAFT_385094 [Leptodontidium sp. 2 PMI_412]